jgi:hypothetical protein
LSSGFDNAVFGHLAESYGLRDNARAEDKKIADSIRSSLLPHQLNVITDKCRWKAVLCPRRAGKSYTALSYAFDTCLRKANARVIVVCLTLVNAKDTYWYEIPAWAEKHGIKFRAFQNELRIILPNGSQIKFVSGDSRQEIEKLRGAQYDLVIIDEAKSYAVALLNELIYEIVRPALSDRTGTLMMIGTPGNIMQGPFFETTYPGFCNEKGKLVSRDFSAPEQYWVDHPKDRTFWSRHHWTTKDNTAQPQIWVDFLLAKENAGWADDEPRWRREMLGEWINTEDAFVYAYAHLSSTQPGLVNYTPDYVNGNKFGLAKGADWRYLLGLDLGYEDAFAMVVVAYNPHDGVLYHVWDHHEGHLDIYSVVTLIEAQVERFGQFDAIVADTGGLGKMIVETINQRHGLNIKRAEKTEKFDHIELLNADFRAGRLKVTQRSDLADQLSTLQFDLGKGSKDQLARTGKLREAQSMANDLCDAFLYVWRYSYHYWAEQRPSMAQPGTPEWARIVELEAMKHLAVERTAKANRPDWATWSSGIDPLKGLYDN